MTGRIATLSRFIFRSADRSLLFFKILLKISDFEWSAESEHNFQELKSYLCGLSILNKPTRGEELFVYLEDTARAASSVLVRKEASVHQHIYFVIHALKGAELNYTARENLDLDLVVTARKLRAYLLSHPIIILTNSTLGIIFSHLDTSMRLMKWITELREHDIKFEPGSP